MNILIVDDNQFARECIIDYIKLSNIDVKVHEASNGQQAIEKVDNNSYDLILLDISMPDVNGMEVLKHVRTIDSKVKVIITSVVTTDFQVERANKEGVTAFLQKPVDMNRLIEWINIIKEERE